MPLIFMTEEQKTELENKLVSGDVADIYEHISEAGPQSVNGFPIFMSYKTISKDDLAALGAKVELLKGPGDQI
jgi:hypothetical protein